MSESKVNEAELQKARKARLVAIVLVSPMVLWMGGQLLGGLLGLPARFVFLFDFAALAGFLWALVVTFQLWRARGKDGANSTDGPPKRG